MVITDGMDELHNVFGEIKKFQLQERMRLTRRKNCKFDLVFCVGRGRGWERSILNLQPRLQRALTKDNFGVRTLLINSLPFSPAVATAAEDNHGSMVQSSVMETVVLLLVGIGQIMFVRRMFSGKGTILKQWT